MQAASTTAGFDVAVERVCVSSDTGGGHFAAITLEGGRIEVHPLLRRHHGGGVDEAAAGPVAPPLVFEAHDGEVQVGFVTLRRRRAQPGPELAAAGAPSEPPGFERLNGGKAVQVDIGLTPR